MNNEIKIEYKAYSKADELTKAKIILDRDIEISDYHLIPLALAKSISPLPEFAITILCMTVEAFAADTNSDPLEVIDEMKELITGVIKEMGHYEL